MNKRYIVCIALASFVSLAAVRGDDEVPTVAVARVARRDLFQKLTIQGELRPYQEVELHAMVSGYIQRIVVDIGDRVKAGDLIAVIVAPELNDELAHAIAAKEQATANHSIAHLDFTRLTDASKGNTNLIAPQELDSAKARDRATGAAEAAAIADVSKYTTLLGYSRITAPFDGVITARMVDPGALIQTGGSQSTSLVRLSENNILRLDFPVSVSYVEDISVGEEVEVKFDGSGATLKAPISRFSRRVDMATRTMRTEVEIANSDLHLIPGMYATVVLNASPRPGALAVPVEAIGSLENPSVYVVSPDGMVSEHSVKLGVETPGSFEVLGGLEAGDLVVVGNRSGVHPGQKVEPKVVSTSLYQ